MNIFSHLKINLLNKYCDNSTIVIFATITTKCKGDTVTALIDYVYRVDEQKCIISYLEISRFSIFDIMINSVLMLVACLCCRPYV